MTWLSTLSAILLFGLSATPLSLEAVEAIRSRTSERTRWEKEPHQPLLLATKVLPHSNSRLRSFQDAHSQGRGLTELTSEQEAICACANFTATRDCAAAVRTSCGPNSDGSALPKSFCDNISSYDATSDVLLELSQQACAGIRPEIPEDENSGSGESHPLCACAESLTGSGCEEALTTACTDGTISLDDCLAAADNEQDAIAAIEEESRRLCDAATLTPSEDECDATSPCCGGGGTFQYLSASQRLLKDEIAPNNAPYKPKATATLSELYTYTVSPALPAGMRFDEARGVIGGTPTVSQGNTSYTVSVQCQNAEVERQEATVWIMVEDTLSLQDRRRLTADRFIQMFWSYRVEGEGTEYVVDEVMTKGVFANPELPQAENPIVWDVLETGSWTPYDHVVEYTYLLDPTKNTGILEFTHREVITPSWSEDMLTFRYNLSHVMVITQADTGARSVVEETTYHEELTFAEGSDRVERLYTDLSTFMEQGGASSLPAQYVCETVAEYCGLEAQGQNWADTAYSSVEDCVGFMTERSTCSVEFPLQGDTQACRELHMFNALNFPEAHCNHTGRFSSRCREQADDPCVYRDGGTDGAHPLCACSVSLTDDGCEQALTAACIDGTISLDDCLGANDNDQAAIAAIEEESHRLCSATTPSAQKKAQVEKDKEEDLCEDDDDDLECDFAEVGQVHDYGRMRGEYDYIVVGGGTAGCVLARRLSENPDNTVLLLERGTDQYENTTELLAKRRAVFDRWDSPLTLSFHTGPHPELYNRTLEILAGNMIGGTTGINAGLWSRPSFEEFDEWDVPGWSGEELKEYFKLVETFTPGEAAGDGPGERGSEGPVRVEYGPRQFLEEEYRAAAERGGFVRLEDSTSKQDDVIWQLPTALRNGVQQDAYKAYLESVVPRANLDIFTTARVNRLILDGDLVTGVDVMLYDSSLIEVRVRKEVIVSAGVWGTPQVLMLSGIGPAEHLDRMDIDLEKDLPVGRNVIGRPHVNMIFEGNHGVAPEAASVVSGSDKSSRRWLRDGTGTQSIAVAALYMKFRTNSTLKYWDAFAAFTDVVPAFQASIESMLVQCECASSFSRGKVELATPIPTDNVYIELGLLRDYRDVATLMACMRRMRDINTKEFRFFFEEIAPDIDVQSDAELEAYVRAFGEFGHHAVGSAKMGTVDDPEAVVDPELRVIGYRNLRVADASIMPRLPRSGLMHTTYMIGEYAADLIINTNKSYNSYPLESFYTTVGLCVTLAVFFLALPLVIYLILQVLMDRLDEELEMSHAEVLSSMTPAVEDTNPAREMLPAEERVSLCYFIEQLTVEFGVERKTLLSSMAGSLSAGSLTAVMGPSGCGKSTLLSVLGQELHGDVEMQGMVIGFNRSQSMLQRPISGKSTSTAAALTRPEGMTLVEARLAEQNRWTKKRTTMVTQQDNLPENLTVLELMQYMALLRLPADESTALKMRKCHSCIRDVGLEDHVHTRVAASGGGLSGGQTKRLHVAMNMLSNAPLVLLDEPTSGLDALAALNVVHMISMYALRGHSVVVTIHQPRPEIVELFDQLVLMVHGTQIYSGPFGHAQEDLSAHLRGTSHVDVAMLERALLPGHTDGLLDILAVEPLARDLVTKYQASEIYERAGAQALRQFHLVCGLQGSKEAAEGASEADGCLEKQMSVAHALDEGKRTEGSARLLSEQAAAYGLLPLGHLLVALAAMDRRPCTRRHNPRLANWFKANLKVNSLYITILLLALLACVLYGSIAKANVLDANARTSCIFVMCMLAINSVNVQYAMPRVQKQEDSYWHYVSQGIVSELQYSLHLQMSDAVVAVSSTFLYQIVVFSITGVTYSAATHLVCLLGFTLIVRISISVTELAFVLFHDQLAVVATHGVWVGCNMLFGGYLLQLHKMSFLVTDWIYWITPLWQTMGVMVQQVFSSEELECEDELPTYYCSDAYTTIDGLGYKKADLRTGLILLTVCEVLLRLCVGAVLLRQSRQRQQLDAMSVAIPSNVLNPPLRFSKFMVPNADEQAAPKATADVAAQINKRRLMFRILSTHDVCSTPDESHELAHYSPFSKSRSKLSRKNLSSRERLPESPASYPATPVVHENVLVEKADPSAAFTEDLGF
ncbi:hypothetical protein CYMTET_13556 [Cymbomonas tetramitiformis]|uniref:ABC transporter domain-containing protein n=1 Tax=Cymbomonas tetramitiformis TaxID=36881 RepID=A0AAE0GID5_9CHLO|nr:hypothetical protein CYMTET_13556 [Cymbomonas tetramitiformis]